ncbi:unnamed protein product, partial [Dicrocoelium dendriticum]
YKLRGDELHGTLLLIQDDLHSLESWCCTWVMNLSAMKSSIMPYGCCIPEGSITLNSERVPTQLSTRDLDS